MKLAKWGNSLAIRIPAQVIEKLKLVPGEEIQITVTGEHEFRVSRDRTRQQAIDKLRTLRFVLPDDYTFHREELHER